MKSTSGDPQPAGYATRPMEKSTAAKLWKSLVKSSFTHQWQNLSTWSDPEKVKTEQQQQWRRQGVRMERRTVSTWGTEYEIQDVRYKVQDGEYRMLNVLKQGEGEGIR